MRLLEMYDSVQGEGPRTGQPVTFVRFAGCNMRCPGWPCDTQHAIEPSLFSGKFENLSPSELFNRLPRYPELICVTGGEPFLQKGMHDFLRMAAGLHSIDVFTNGSFPYESWLFQPAYEHVRLIMDWKLGGSGEADTARAERVVNAGLLSAHDSIKFVVTDMNDLTEAREAWLSLRALGCRAEFWVGAAWGHIEDAVIVDFVLDNELPWRLNVQQHKHIWDPEETLR